MTRFDEAPSSEADGWRWLRPIGRQPAVFVATVVAIGLLVCVAAAVLFATEAAKVQLARLAAGTQVAVVLGPQVTRTDAEAMRSSFESVPLVAEARLQTREQALTRLAGASSLVGSRNPLPDLWVLSVREPQTDAALQSFADDRTRLEQTLAGMPGVASVRVDHEWLGFVDRMVVTALRVLPVVHGVTLGLLATLVFCIAFVTGRAVGENADGAGGAGPALVTGLLAGLFGLAGAAAFGAAIGNIAGRTTIEWAGLQPALRVSVDSPLLWLVATVLVVSALGAVVGAYDSARQSIDRIPRL